MRNVTCASAQRSARRKYGTCLRTGSSNESLPSLASIASAVLVNAFDVDAIWNNVSGPTGCVPSFVP